MHHLRVGDDLAEKVVCTTLISPVFTAKLSGISLGSRHKDHSIRQMSSFEGDGVAFSRAAKSERSLFFESGARDPHPAVSALSSARDQTASPPPPPPSPRAPPNPPAPDKRPSSDRARRTPSQTETASPAPAAAHAGSRAAESCAAHSRGPHSTAPRHLR